jgi:ABC-type multidrug transport system permease subunit
MGLFLAALVFVIGIVLAISIVFAGSMRTTGNRPGDGAWALRAFATCCIIAALLILSHYHPVSW